MQDMIALRASRYDRKKLVAGDRFQAKPRDVRVLQAMRLAELAPIVETPKRAYIRRDMIAETAPAVFAPRFDVEMKAEPKKAPKAKQDDASALTGTGGAKSPTGHIADD